MGERKYTDWATTDIADIGNGDPNKDDPGAPKQASGFSVEKPEVQEMNWLLNLLGHYGRANNEFKIEATTYEAEAGEIVLMNNSSAAATGFLPASPIAGQWVVFGGSHQLVGVDANSVFIDGNGNDIMITSDDNCQLDMNEHLFLFWYDGTIWKLNIWGIQGVVS